MTAATMAQVAGLEWGPTLVNAGVAGAMLFWFAVRVEKRLKSLENSDNRKTRAILLLVISLKSASEGAKTEAKAIVKELDVAEGGKEEEGT